MEISNWSQKQYVRNTNDFGLEIYNQYVQIRKRQKY